MLKLRPKFDLRKDVVSDVLRKEASVCRVKGEEALATAASLTRQVCVFPTVTASLRHHFVPQRVFAKACGVPGMTGNTPTCLLRNVGKKRRKRSLFLA